MRSGEASGHTQPDRVRSSAEQSAAEGRASTIERAKLSWRLPTTTITFSGAGRGLPSPAVQAWDGDLLAFRAVQLVDLVVELLDLLVGRTADPSVGEYDLFLEAASLGSGDLPRNEFLDQRLRGSDEGPLLRADECPRQLGGRFIDVDGDVAHLLHPLLLEAPEEIDLFVDLEVNVREALDPRVEDFLQVLDDLGLLLDLPLQLFEPLVRDADMSPGGGDPVGDDDDAVRAERNRRPMVEKLEVRQ